MVTGSRQYTDYEKMSLVLYKYCSGASVIITGGAFGADRLAKRYAQENGIKYGEIRPDYARYGSKAAPLRRNLELVSRADKVIAFYMHTRKGGTLHAAKEAARQGKLVVEIIGGEENVNDAQGTLF